MKSKLSFITLFLLSIGVFAQTANQHGGIYGFSENLVYVMADGGRFFKSENAGISWEESSTGVNVEFYDLNFYDGNLGLAVGQDGKILKTTNSGQSWTEIPSGTTNNLYSIGIGALNNFYIVGDAGTVLHSINEGETWNTIPGISSERLNHINFKNADTAYIAGDNGSLLFTENGGSSWETLDVGNTDDLYVASVTDNAVQLLVGPTRDYLFREGENTLVSSNNLDWNSFTMYGQIPAPYSGFHFQNDSEGYAVSSAELLCECCYIEIIKTMDGGASWDFLYWEEFGMNTCNADIGFSDISFVNDQYGYVLIGNYVFTITPNEVFSSAIILKTNEYEQALNFVLYPNPASKTIRLQVKNQNIEKMYVDIMDITGKTVLSKNMTATSKEIDIDKLSSGMYFVFLKQDERTIGYKKLIKN